MLKLLPLREVVSSYIGGGWGSEDETAEFSEPAWVVRGTDFAKLRIGDSSSCPHRFHKPANLRTRVLRPGDIVMEVSGGSKDQPVGRAVLMTDRLLREFDGKVLPASFCKLVRPDPTQIDPPYMYYLLQHLYDSRQVLQYQIQSTGISNFQFETFLDGQLIGLPPLNTQRKIVAILSAYDDLIENHNRRIKVLEEMAQRIYREWFVDFRYPGRERIPLVDSELGPIPQGLMITVVRELVQRVPQGRVYQGSDVGSEGVVPIIDQSRDEIAGFHNDEPSVSASPGDPALLFGDHTCKMQVVTEPFSVGPNVVVFRPATPLPALVLFRLLSGLVHTEEYKRHWTSLCSKLVVVPDTEAAARYSGIIESAHLQSSVLRKMNRVLRASRDLLLPRLISGELDVTGINVATAEDAA